MPKNTSAADKLIKLKKCLKKDLLALNSELPNDLGRLWVTCNELHDRLVHAGVDQSLNVDMVQDAIQRFNNNQKFLAVREFDHSFYY